jgi:hypothetical protein
MITDHLLLRVVTRFVGAVQVPPPFRVLQEPPRRSRVSTPVRTRDDNRLGVGLTVEPQRYRASACHGQERKRRIVAYAIQDTRAAGSGEWLGWFAKRVPPEPTLGLSPALLNRAVE